MLTNRIVTRGFGMSRGVPGRAGPVTQGYGGPPTFVAIALTPQQVARRIHGRSGKRHGDDIEFVVLWAKLIEVNSRQPERPVEGSVKVQVSDRSKLSVIVESFVKRVWSGIKVTAKRIK